MDEFSNRNSCSVYFTCLKIATSKTQTKNKTAMYRSDDDHDNENNTRIRFTTAIFFSEFRSSRGFFVFFYVCLSFSKVIDVL